MWLLTVIPVVTAAIVGLVTYLSPEIPPLKKWTVIALTVITIFVVTFNGWSVEHQKSVAQQANKEAINSVAALIDDGVAIQQSFLSTNDLAAIKTQYAAWFEKSKHTLTTKLDASYATAFVSAPNVSSMPVNHSMEGDGYWAAIEGKNIVLNNIVIELRRSQ